MIWTFSVIELVLFQGQIHQLSRLWIRMRIHIRTQPYPASNFKYVKIILPGDFFSVSEHDLTGLRFELTVLFPGLIHQKCNLCICIRIKWIRILNTVFFLMYIHISHGRKRFVDQIFTPANGIAAFLATKCLRHPMVLLGCWLSGKLINICRPASVKYFWNLLYGSLMTIIYTVK